MKSKTIITLVVIALIALGGLVLLPTMNEPLTKLQPLEKSPLTANAVLMPERPIAGEQTKMTFTFTDSAGKPVTDLMVHHGRHVHVVIVSKDLATIGHIHPQDFTTDVEAEVASGVYSVEYAFPAAGKYIVAVDVMNSKDALAQQFIVNVSGNPKLGKVSTDLSLEKCFVGHTEQGADTYRDPVLVSKSEVLCPEGYKVTLAPASKTIVAGEDTLLRFHFEKDGKPVTDLVPYLSAALHLAIVPESLGFVLHRHGVVDEGGDEHSSSMDMGHSEMPASHDMSSMVMDTSGIHIMADGSVMLGNGKTVADATVSSDGMIHMPDGTMVKPAMDMRASAAGESMGDMHDMEGMHHHDTVPSSFGPDLVSEVIQFPRAGMYRVFAQAKHGNEIIVASFMLEVEPVSAGTTGESKSFDLTIQDKKVVSGSGDIQVQEGDTVTLTVTNDTDEEIHVHGYNVSTKLKAGVASTLTFKASATGRFPFELEDSKTDIGSISVLPR